jgi:hypothetical protein
MDEMIKFSIDTTALNNFLKQSDDTQKEMMLRYNNSEYQTLLITEKLARFQDDFSISTETTRSQI